MAMVSSPRNQRAISPAPTAMPVPATPKPTITPGPSTAIHHSVIALATSSPAPNSISAGTQTARAPCRSKSAPASGAASPWAIM